MEVKINDVSIDELKSYVYLDEIEIDGLYNQLFPNIIEETIRYDIDKNDKLNANIGGNAFGVLKTEGELQHLCQNSISTEVKTILPIEYKSNILIKHICDNHLNSLESIVEAANEFNPLIRGRIIVGYATFVLTHVYDCNDQLIDLMNISNNYDRRNSTLILESGCRKEIKELRRSDEPNYYETFSAMGDKYGFEMHMSGNKIRREIRHLTQIIRKGRAFNLAILGHISHAGGIHYSIKPFAVW